MTTLQSEQAKALLRECLDWVGVVELTDEEEEKAEGVQVRLERLLIDLGELPDPRMPASDPHDLYHVVINCREKLRIAVEERDASRTALDDHLRTKGVVSDHEKAMVYIRRHQIAYHQWELAENQNLRAEADYYRALKEVKG